MKAIDHTECFRSGPHLSPKVAFIDRVKDNRVYGLFPEFQSRLNRRVVADCAERLRGVDRETLRRYIAEIPPEWDVNRVARDALATLILDRADFLADHIMDMLWPQRELGFMGEEEGES